MKQLKDYVFTVPAYLLINLIKCCLTILCTHKYHYKVIPGRVDNLTAKQLELADKN